MVENKYTQLSYIGQAMEDIFDQKFSGDVDFDKSLKNVSGSNRDYGNDAEQLRTQTLTFTLLQLRASGTGDAAAGRRNE